MIDGGSNPEFSNEQDAHMLFVWNAASRYSRLSSRVTGVSARGKRGITGKDGKMLVIDPISGKDVTPKPLLFAEAPEVSCSPFVSIFVFLTHILL